MNSNGYEQEVNHVLNPDDIFAGKNILKINNVFDVEVTYNLTYIRKYEVTECSKKEIAEVQSKINRRNK